MALEAGLDVELPRLDCYGEPLRERVESGAVALALVDRSVRRVLRMKLELGLFESPYVDEESAGAVYQTAEQRALAREIARKSIVLLQNEGDVLPLDPSLSSLAVIGPCADDVRLQQGDYSYPAHLEMIYQPDGASAAASDILPRSDELAFAPGPYFVPMISLLEGVRAAVSQATQIRVVKGCEITGDAMKEEGFAEAVEAARASQVAIVAVGGKSGLTRDCTSGEFRDAADLRLTGVQQDLVLAVAATGTPTIVVLMNGRVFALAEIAERVAAIVEAWLPGEEGGGAIADVLFGRTNPAGRLPISLPRSVGQVPIYYNHKSGGGRSQMLGDYSDLPTTPLFPFGHGLSYTRFEYGALEVKPLAVSPEATVSIALDLSNTGERAGDEVVQLYLRDPVASVTRPVKQLAGFLRLHLQPGETRRLRFRLDLSQLSFYDTDMRLVVEPGEVRVMVGASSADVRAEASFTIEGKLRELRPADLVATQVELP